MVALGYLAKMTIGDGSAFADGLSCTPGSGLSVIIGPGSMTLPTVIDAEAYGALPPDSDPLIKLGINTASTILPLPATGDVVISATVVEAQTGSAAVFYYNAQNPAQTLIGIQGSGAAQATVVQQRVSLLATTAAAVPSGYTPLGQINILPNASAVDATMITPAAGRHLSSRSKLPQAAPLLSPGFVGTPTAPTPIVGDATSTLATTAFVAAATTRNRVAWGTGGTYNWTCPTGVTTILVRSLGGWRERGANAASGFPGRWWGWGWL